MGALPIVEYPFSAVDPLWSASGHLRRPSPAPQLAASRRLREAQARPVLDREPVAAALAREARVPLWVSLCIGP